MIKVRARNDDGDAYVIFGLSATNIESLKAGDALVFRADQLDAPFDLAFMYGETDEAIAQKLSVQGMAFAGVKQPCAVCTCPVWDQAKPEPPPEMPDVEATGDLIRELLAVLQRRNANSTQAIIAINHAQLAVALETGTTEETLHKMVATGFKLYAQHGSTGL